MSIYVFPIASSIAALLYGCFLIYLVLTQPTGTEKMQKIAKAIQEGANAYLNRQYKMISIVGIVVFFLLTWQLGFLVGIGFIIGSVLSGAAGYIGMNISVRGNIRVAEAAKKGISPALNIAFRSGSITGMLVVGLALLGITIFYIILKDMCIPYKRMVEALVALSFGASLISIFARLGGGIFTKGADVGADVILKMQLMVILYVQKDQR
ncbi:unnamed protein product [marine sediment metagenome]|uniref:Uncharacterized protein n=1 Tax=marine sediment metagenome TaxID=412755 RepID=X0YV21_9ZZZZ